LGAVLRDGDLNCPGMLAVGGGDDVGMQPRPQTIVCALEPLVRVVELVGQLRVAREPQLELCRELACPVGGPADSRTRSGSRRSELLREALLQRRVQQLPRQQSR
jgi:hypothetical protein